MWVQAFLVITNASYKQLEQPVKFKSQGLQAKLKQTLITMMVTSNKRTSVEV